MAVGFPLRSEPSAILLIAAHAVAKKPQITFLHSADQLTAIPFGQKSETGTRKSSHAEKPDCYSRGQTCQTEPRVRKESRSRTPSHPQQANPETAKHLQSKLLIIKQS